MELGSFVNEFDGGILSLLLLYFMPCEVTAFLFPRE
jgi:hypothetical protein